MTNISEVPLASESLYHSDREQMGRHLCRLFAISGQRLYGGGEARLMHSAFSWDLARLRIFSSGSNLRARMSVATIIICILTQGWVCYVRSVRPKSAAAIFMTFKEFVTFSLSLGFTALAESQRSFSMQHQGLNKQSNIQNDYFIYVIKHCCAVIYCVFSVVWDAAILASTLL